MIQHEEAKSSERPMTLEDRRVFLRLPIEERRRQLAEQAAEAVGEYERESATRDRLEWQGGDISEI